MAGKISPLTWTAPPDGGSPIKGYRILVYEGTNLVGTLTSTTANVQVTASETLARSVLIQAQNNLGYSRPLRLGVPAAVATTTPTTPTTPTVPAGTPTLTITRLGATKARFTLSSYPSTATQYELFCVYEPSVSDFPPLIERYTTSGPWEVELPDSPILFGDGVPWFVKVFYSDKDPIDTARVPMPPFVAPAPAATAPVIAASRSASTITVSESTAGTNVATSTLYRDGAVVRSPAALPYTETSDTAHSYQVVVANTAGATVNSNTATVAAYTAPSPASPHLVDDAVLYTADGYSTYDTTGKTATANERTLFTTVPYSNPDFANPSYTVTWFKFQVTGDPRTIEITGLPSKVGITGQNSPTPQDTALLLFSATSGTVTDQNIATALTFIVRDDEGASGDSQPYVSRNLALGWYYVGIGHFTPNPGFRVSGQRYAMRGLTVAPSAAPAAPQTEAGPHRIGDATMLSMDGTTAYRTTGKTAVTAGENTLAITRLVTWFKFYVDALRNVQITGRPGLVGFTEPTYSSADTYGYLFKGTSGNLTDATLTASTAAAVAVDDDAGGEGQFSITRALTPGWYYFAAGAYAATSVISVDQFVAIKGLSATANPRSSTYTFDDSTDATAFTSEVSTLSTSGGNLVITPNQSAAYAVYDGVSRMRTQRFEFQNITGQGIGLVWNYDSIFTRYWQINNGYIYRFNNGSADLVTNAGVTFDSGDTAAIEIDPTGAYRLYKGTSTTPIYSGTMPVDTGPYSYRYSQAGVAGVFAVQVDKAIVPARYPSTFFDFNIAADANNWRAPLSTIESSGGYLRSTPSPGISGRPVLLYAATPGKAVTNHYDFNMLSRSVAGNDGGLIWNFTDENNFWYRNVNKVGYRKAGVDTDIATTSTALNGDASIEIDPDGAFRIGEDGVNVIYSGTMAGTPLPYTSTLTGVWGSNFMGNARVPS